jgi:hypothetical protein
MIARSNPGGHCLTGPMIRRFSCGVFGATRSYAATTANDLRFTGPQNAR